MTERLNPARLFLLALTAVALYLCYIIFRPYAGPVLLSLVFAVVFYPLHRRFARRIQSPNSTAFLSTVTTLAVTAVPLVFLGIAVTHELSTAYESLARSAGESGVIAYLFHGIQNVMGWFGRHFPVPSVDVRAIVMRRAEELSSALVRLGAGLLGNLLQLVANAAIASLVLFFLFRDGESALKYLSSVLPLPQERVRELLERINSTLVANFYGGVAVGAAQGSLTALAFWALGLGSPILWGLVTAVFSLLPIIGSAAVWVPAGVALLFSGHIIKGIILLAWGAGVIGLADNVVRPWVISGRTRLHPVFVFLSLLGGVQVFGLLGLFIGPVILSVTAAVLEMLQVDYGSNQSPKSSILD